MQLISKLGPIRLAVIAGVTLALIGFFVYLTGRLTAPDMTVLYADLDPAEAGRIVSKLESMNVPVQTAGDGSRILVPAGQAARLRMAMAEEGLPSGGSIGYEVFDKASALGNTSFAQRINQMRAMEGELARSIRTLAGVKAARVHLVLPKREMFSREVQEPSASIVLGLRGTAALGRQQVQAIQQLVAAAVPQLKPTRISVIDDKGNLLARGGDDAAGYAAAQTANELRTTYEGKLARTVEQLLERTIGFGKVRAEVSARMDFDRVTTKAETFDPNGQVVRSTQTVTEDAASHDADKQESVSVATNTPDRAATDKGGATGAQRTSKNNRNEETVNYEITRTTRTHVQEGGGLQRLSVAVLVDGTYKPGTGAERIYEPRSPEELKRLETLVKSAVGYDEQRGDTVEVVNLRFARADEDAAAEVPEPFVNLEKSDYFRIAELAILGVVGVLVVLMVARPMVTRLIPAPAPAAVPEDATRLLPAGAPQAALAAPDGSAAMAAPEEADETFINLDMVEGRVKASAFNRIGQIVEKHPEEAVGILRQWMYQEN